MTTLQVCSYYTDSKLYKNLFASLDKLGEPSHIFYFTDKNGPLPEEDVILSRAYNRFERFLYFVKHKKVYRDLLSQIDIKDYSHSHAHSLMSNGYISYLLKKDYGLKYSTAIRRTDLFFFMKYKPYLKGLGAKILDEAEDVVFLSPVFLDQAEKVFGPKMKTDLRAKSHIIPNGIEPIYLENQPDPKDLDGPLRLVFIGKASDPNKNLKTIISATDRLRERGEDVSLDIIGSMDEGTKKALESKSYANILGRLSPEEIIPILREDHIYIMPSYTETFGLVYVEAMSQGLPVIYTRGQGFDGQFPEGHVGYSVDPDSVDEIIRAIEKISEDYPAMSARAIEGAKAYNWLDIGKEYKEIYEKIRRS